MEPFSPETEPRDEALTPPEAAPVAEGEPESEAAPPAATGAASEAAPARKKWNAAALAAELIKAVALLLVGALLALILVPNAWVSRLDGMSVANKLDLLKQMVRAYYIDGDAADYESMSDLLSEAYIYGLGDPYSIYFSAEEYNELLRANQGDAYGIGVSIVPSLDPVAIYIYHVYEGSPAQEAGLKDGDRIVAVAGETVTAENYNERVSAVRGTAGSAVTLTVLRDGATFDLDVVRRDHVITSVYARVVDGVGVVEITGFNQATADQFKQAIDTLLKEDVTALVFDLRGNLGGLVDTTTEMLDVLLPSGELGYAVYNGGKRESMGFSDASEVDLPMAVLVDKDTASSSEYFASALRDFEKGILVGETTYGKGIMQTTYPLGDGSAVRLTVAKFYTKSGTEFHDVGLAPDIEVSLPEGASRYFLTDEEDSVLRAALDALKKK